MALPNKRTQTAIGTQKSHIVDLVPQSLRRGATTRTKFLESLTDQRLQTQEAGESGAALAAYERKLAAVLDSEICEKENCHSKRAPTLGTGSSDLHVRRKQKFIKGYRTAELEAGAVPISSVEEDREVDSPCSQGIIRDRPAHMAEKRRRKRRRRAKSNRSLTLLSSAAPVALNSSSDSM